MEQKEIEFRVELAEKLPEVDLDKDKIAATLVNLLGNATKYTPQGGRVALRANVTDQQLIVEVEDTGFGISEDEQAKVFDKFFRSGDERVQDETGSGLGLSLAQEVVRLHGGELGVRSELDRGSTFTMSVPIG